MPSDRPLARIDELLARYDDPTACVAALLCDDHPSGDVAYTIVSADGDSRVVTFGELSDQSARFAAGLAELGVGEGDRVATLLGKTVEHLVAVLAIWRLGAVHVPLFTAFAPPAIAMRLSASGAKAVVCDTEQRPKLDLALADGIAPRVVVVGGPTTPTDLDFATLLADDVVGPATVGGRAPIIQIYTSGTTGRPKGVVVPTMALASFQAYMEFGLDVRPGDVYWNAADPGWAYGLYYGLVGALCTGLPGIWVQGAFTPAGTLDVLSRFGVTNFAAAPTVYRALRASELPIPADLRLQRASAAGEPLTPEINQWSQDALGVTVHDHYGQTETGMLVNNHHHPDVARPIQQGSMGHTMPGWTTVVLQDGADEPAPAGTVGRLAVDLSASRFAWFDGYLDEPERSADKFSADGRWYLTGDSARVDDRGYHTFLSRDDDVIIMAGYRIGPFDVESVLLTHPDVVEAAVVAAPDDLRGQVVEAHVVLRDGTEGTPKLAEELQQLVKTQYAAHAYPRRVHFPTQLPKTPSGKVQRYVLRQYAVGASSERSGQ